VGLLNVNLRQLPLEMYQSGELKKKKKDWQPTAAELASKPLQAMG
jgi:hypothetical protein